MERRVQNSLIVQVIKHFLGAKCFSDEVLLAVVISDLSYEQDISTLQAQASKRVVAKVHKASTV